MKSKIKQPWEQLENESAKAHAQFNRYRNMKPGERNVNACFHEWRQEIGKPTVAEAAGYYRQWSIRFKWNKRASAWDAITQKAADEAAIETAQQMAARHVKIARSVQAKSLRAFNKTAGGLTAREAAPILFQAATFERLSRGEATGIQENIGGNISITGILSGIQDGEKSRIYDLLGEISKRERQVGASSPVPLLPGPGETDNGGNGKGHNS